MGREAKLEVDDGTTRAEARAHLDSEHLTIGPPFRLKLPLGVLKQVRATPSGLSLENGRTRLLLTMSEKEATAWAKNILHPPSLATKLGLKSGIAVFTLGAMPPEIAGALKEAAPQSVKLGKAMPAGLVFATVPEAVPIKDLPRLARSLASGSAIWLIYQKGQAFNGDDLIREGRAAGLKDTKVARISETHTALRFISRG